MRQKEIAKTSMIFSQRTSRVPAKNSPTMFKSLRHQFPPSCLTVIFSDLLYLLLFSCYDKMSQPRQLIEGWVYLSLGFKGLKVHRGVEALQQDKKAERSHLQLCDDYSWLSSWLCLEFSKLKRLGTPIKNFS